MVMLAIVASLVAITSLLAIGNRATGADTVQSTKALQIAEAGIEKVLDAVYYNTYANWLATNQDGRITVIDATAPPSTPPAVKSLNFDACAFKKYLTGHYNANASPAHSIEKDKNNVTGCVFAANTTSYLPSAAPFGLVGKELFNDKKVTSADYPSLKGTIGTDGSFAATVARRDTASEVNLDLEVIGQVAAPDGTIIAVKKVARTIKVAAPPFIGDRFALLTNATNCSFCHMQIDTIQRVYAPTADANKLFERARVAILGKNLEIGDEFHHRDTVVVGTIYTRSASIPDATNGIEMKAVAWDTDPGFIKGQTSSGNTLLYPITGSAPLWLTDAQYLDGQAAGVRKNGKLYYNYPKAAQVPVGADGQPQWPDGEVPERFPTVIPDGGDGIVSNSDWDNYIAVASTGSLKVGASTTAKIYGVARGTGVYDPAALSFATSLAAPADMATLVANPSGYKGWILRQALASPNNHDFYPPIYSDRTQHPAGVTVLYKDITTAPAPPANPSLVLPAVLAPTGGAMVNPQVTNNTGGQVIFGLAAGVPTITKVTSGGTLNNTTSGTQPAPSNVPVRDSGNAITNVGPLIINDFGGSPLTSQGFRALLPYSGGTAATNFGLSNNGTMNLNFYVEYDPTGTGRLSLIFCADNNSAATFPSSTTTASKITSTTANPNGASVNRATDPRNVNCPSQTAARQVSVTGIGAGELFKSNLTEITNTYNGNVVIDAGTIDDAGNFITIDGTVNINGDLIIRGKIQGEGRLVVRGNVYIVGDLVYSCKSDSNKACKTYDGNNPSYGNPEKLPKLALLAGGGIFMGDYDHPDFRTVRSQFGMINDQNAQYRNPSFTQQGTTNAVTTPIPWSSYNIPGSTGLNRNSVSGPSLNYNTTGFVSRVASIPNSSYKTDKSKPFYAPSPFGFISDIQTNDNYEDGNANNFVSNAEMANKGIMVMASSNGPLWLGSSANNGLRTAIPAADPPVSCTNTTNNDALVLQPPITNTAATITMVRFTNVAGKTDTATFLAPFNFGFWCPPATLTAPQFRDGTIVGTSPSLLSGSVPNLNLLGISNTPAGNATVWMTQGTSATIEANGMSVGWMAGLFPNTSGKTAQIGDLSSTRLVKLMYLASMENGNRRPDGVNLRGAFRTDGVFYSANAVYGTFRYQRDQYNVNGGVATTQSRWIHNGTVAAAELAFLATGNVDSSKLNQPFVQNNFDNPRVNFGPVADDLSNPKNANKNIFYDSRLQGLINITSGETVGLRRTGTFSQVEK
jgi:hypothetical protein